MSVRSLARELGVSATAVSLALQNSPRISPQLRRVVQQLAKRRGHVPNARLAALLSEVRQSATAEYRATLGVISLFPEERPWIERPLYAHLGRVVAGARERAEEHGYKLEEFWVKQPGLTPDARTSTRRYVTYLLTQLAPTRLFAFTYLLLHHILISSAKFSRISLRSHPIFLSRAKCK